MNLEFLDQKRLAVVLRDSGKDRLLCGTGDYRRHDAERELALDVDPGTDVDFFETTIVIREDEWEGEILEDTQYGCNYRIEVELT